MRGIAQQIAASADGFVVIALPTSIFSAAAVLAAALPTFPRAVVVPLPAPVRGLAASDSGVVSVAGGRVRVFDPLGRPVRSIGDQIPDGLRPVARVRGPQEGSPVPGTTADSGWALPYDPDDVDNRDDPRLADEIVPQRVSRPHQTADEIAQPDPSQGLVMAAGATHAWLGRPDGLWRIDFYDAAATRVFAANSDAAAIRAVAASPDGGTVAAVNATHVFRSRDHGHTFDIVATIAGRLRAFSAARSGTVFLVDDDGLRMVRAGHVEAESLGLPGVIAAISCPEETVALAQGVLYAISDPPTTGVMNRIASAPPGTRGIACAANGNTWIAHGVGLWSTTDRGRTWIERPDLPPAPILDAAVTDLAIWIATPSGLVRLAISPPPPLAAGPPPASSSTPVMPAFRAPIANPPTIARWWHAGLPRIDIYFTTSRTTVRHDVSAWVMATFMLDRPHFVPGHVAAAKEATRLATNQGQLRVLLGGAPPGTGTDPIAIEERRALARILEEQP